MKTSLTVALIVSSLAVATLASAAQPTQADFDACNRMAQAAGSSPSASPQAGGATGPSITTPSGTPDSTGGVQQGGGAGKTGPMITGSGRDASSTGGVREGTGAVAKDATGAPSAGTPNDQLQGMAEQGMKDPAYKTAYQDCMKKRGF
jgi:hypothetical protein